MRVDTWDQIKMEPEQAGKPSSTIQMHAALVDSSGRLLWTLSGSETAEGPYHDAVAEPPGAGAGIHGNIADNTASGPPSLSEVLTRLFTRWAPQFPSRSLESSAN
jgi:hypothetical protein